MTTSISEDAAGAIRAQALELGFDICRFADLDEAWPAAARLTQFIEAGRHGEMAWMADTAARRAHPRAMWEDARSAVVLGVNYGPDTDPLAALGEPTTGTISVYAQGDDYHELIKGRLKTLARWLQSRFGGELKVFVDTAPLLEKPLAERAGVGWQGRHTNLVSREFGSWLFLGSILTSLELAPDPPAENHCGACTACLDICPTGAFPAPYQLDARRCISYLTIELKGPIPREFRPALGSRIYGCDDCLAVCPWNKFANRQRAAPARPRRPALARAFRPRRPGRPGLPDPVLQEPGQAHRPGPLPAQRPLRHRQFRRAGAGGEGPGLARRRLTSRARRRSLGVVAVDGRGGVRGLGRCTGWLRVR